MKKKLSIVVPAYNEENLLKDFLEELTLSLKEIGVLYEILIIENGSKDHTLSIARQAAKDDPRIAAFHIKNPSYGRALEYGLKKAVGEYVIIFNVDFWDRNFLQLAVKDDLLGADLLVASKNLPQSKDRRPFKRRLITKGFVFFLKIFLGFKGTDTHGIKIFRKNVLDRLLANCKIKNSLFDTELIIRAQRAGFKISEVPIEVKEIRAARFKGRFWATPKDLCELFLILRK